MKKILWSLILCLTCISAFSQNASDMGELLMTKLEKFSPVEITQNSDDLFIASFIGEKHVTIDQAKRLIDKEIVNEYEDVNVVEPWTQKYDYELPAETIFMYVDNNEDEPVFSIGIAVLKIDKYHTAITMLIARGSRLDAKQEK